MHTKYLLENKNNIEPSWRDEKCIQNFDHNTWREQTTLKT